MHLYNPPSQTTNKTEQEGFEPPVPFGTTVFKTVALNRSATAPNISVWRIAYSEQYKAKSLKRKGKNHSEKLKSED